MNLVLCMAGLYARFRRAGYGVPKYLLPWRGRPIIETILATMLADGAITQLCLVTNERDRAHLPRLRQILRSVGGPPALVMTTADTAGQASTAALGARGLRGAGASVAAAPLLLHNIDTILLGRDYAAIARTLRAADGYIDVFSAASPAFSYVGLGDAGQVCRIAEKEVISNLATSGLYGFRSAAHFLDRLGTAEDAREHYVSDVYANMLRAGMLLRAGPAAPPDQTIVLGTPEEYEAAQ